MDMPVRRRLGDGDVWYVEADVLVMADAAWDQGASAWPVQSVEDAYRYVRFVGSGFAPFAGAGHDRSGRNLTITRLGAAYTAHALLWSETVTAGEGNGDGDSDGNTTGSARSSWPYQVTTGFGPDGLVGDGGKQRAKYVYRGGAVMASIGAMDAASDSPNIATYGASLDMPVLSADVRPLDLIDVEVMGHLTIDDDSGFFVDAVDEWFTAHWVLDMQRTAERVASSKDRKSVV